MKMIELFAVTNNPNIEMIRLRVIYLELQWLSPTQWNVFFYVFLNKIEKSTWIDSEESTNLLFLQIKPSCIKMPNAIIW